MRIDWRRMSGHSNIRARPPDLPSRVSETHYHSFDLNFNPNTSKMRGNNLPLADECSEPLDDFEALCAYVGRAFKINNMNLVPRPQWKYDLLL
jgi:hypothetical protein